MKKVILLILPLIISVLSFSCKNGPSKTAGYTCSEEVYYLDDFNRTIKITYPVISGTDNDELICSILKEAAISNMEHYLRYTNTEGFYRYTIDSVSAAYTSDKLASFLCVGSYSDEGSSHPESIIYTINLGLKDSKIYSFEELVSDFNFLSDKFKAGRFRLVSGIDGLLDMTSHEDIFIEYSSLYGIYPPLYFIAGDNKTELAFSVGLVYTLGGHAEFSIDVNSVKNALTETLIELLK
jgi:hypothetical protein